MLVKLKLVNNNTGGILKGKILKVVCEQLKLGKHC